MMKTAHQPDLALQKACLRADMKARRATLNEANRARAAWLLGECLFDWLERRPQRSIGVYLARPFELSLDSLAQTLIRHGFVVAAPRLDLASQTLEFHRLRDIERVEIGPYRVRQPLAGERVWPEVVLVPGLAFDARGHRLGAGGGWYDRVLDSIPVKIGVGFDCLIVPDVPVEAHDSRMDFVVSDAQWIEVKP